VPKKPELTSDTIETRTAYLSLRFRGKEGAAIWTFRPNERHRYIERIPAQIPGIARPQARFPTMLDGFNRQPD